MHHHPPTPVSCMEPSRCWSCASCSPHQFSHPDYSYHFLVPGSPSPSFSLALLAAHPLGQHFITGSQLNSLLSVSWDQSTANHFTSITFLDLDSYHY